MIDFKSIHGYQVDPNTIELYDSVSGHTALYNYGKLIAVKDSSLGKCLYVTNYWDYSRTTMKRLNNFINQSAAETRKQIQSGEIDVVEV